MRFFSTAFILASLASLSISTPVPLSTANQVCFTFDVIGALNQINVLIQNDVNTALTLTASEAATIKTLVGVAQQTALDSLTSASGTLNSTIQSNSAIILGLTGQIAAALTVSSTSG